jgi:hypothetical protein
VLRRPADAETEVVAAVLPAALANPDALRGLADPTARQPVAAGMLSVTAPAGAAAAIALAKLGRLLPAVLAVPLDVATDLAARALIGIAPAEVLGYPAMEGAGLRIVASAPVPLVGVPPSSIWPSSSAVRKPPRRRWCASTPSASPVICWARCAAIVASNCAGRFIASRNTAPASCCIWRRRAAASAW